jgi:hypothetical protein
MENGESCPNGGPKQSDFVPAFRQANVRQIYRLSDCEDDPAEGAALNQVTQSFRRFCQLKQRQYDLPSFNHCRLWLGEQGEALDAGPFPD